MTGFLIRRILQAIIVILGVVLIVFLLGKLIPGGEAAAALGPRRTPAQVAHFNLVNGLDLPIYDQFWRYIWGLVPPQPGLLLQEQRGSEGAHLAAAAQDPDPGRRVHPRGARHRGAARHPAGGQALPLIDYTLTSGSFLFYAMPPFFLGFLLILYFCFDFHLFPVSPPINSTRSTIFTDPRAFVLPVITLSAITIASFSRYMRSSMMDALTQDYVRTARAKGASNNRVLYGHALRNASSPSSPSSGCRSPPSPAAR